MTEKKLLTLDMFDSMFNKLNIHSYDGDKPSPLHGISLTTCDSNLHQHGGLCNIIYSIRNVLLY